MEDIKKRNKKSIYKTTVTWSEEKKAFLCSLGKQTIEIAASLESKKYEGMWTPEKLFVASVEGFIKDTFVDYAKRSNFEFLSYESKAEGAVEKVEDKFMFSEIKIRPKIIVASSSQIEKAKELIGLAEKNCFISNSIACKITVYPEIEVKF